MSQRFRAWLQLLRAPNLFTVPGDPLAGFLLATYGGLDWRVLVPIAASLCFYSAGLLMNDLCDLEEDRRERPNRPLPARQVSTGAVRRAILLLGGIGLLALIVGTNFVAAGVGIGLLGLIALYNGFTKRAAGIGALNMGLCRAFSLILGAAAANPSFATRAPGAWDAAAILCAYIAAVTFLAGFETKTRAPVLAKLLPALAALAGLVVIFQATGYLQIPYATAIFAVGFIAVTAETCKLFGRNSPPLPPSIGSFIRLLLVFQAAFCVIYGFGWTGRVCAISLVLLLPIAAMTSRRFYAS
ncbi:MAG: UbiA family prenyltransferase [Chthoniobacteraceae bacterium]